VEVRVRFLRVTQIVGDVGNGENVLLGSSAKLFREKL
jgi:hypothetical protein